MPFLDQQQLREVAGAVIAAKLDDPEQRIPTLLASFPRAYIASRLADKEKRATQIDSDLGQMNDDGVLENGFVPLRVYLENCRAATEQGSRPERKIFERYRNLVDAHVDALRRPFLYMLHGDGTAVDAELIQAELIAAHENLLQQGGPLDARPPFAPGVAVLLPDGDSAAVEAGVKAGILLLFRMKSLDDAESTAGEMGKQIPGFLAAFGKPAMPKPPTSAPAVALAPSKDAPPRYLPYTCDRSANYARFAALKGRLAAYLIEGPEEEAHDAFHERLSREFLRGRAGIAPISPGDPSRINWPPPSAADLVSHVAMQLIPGCLASEPTEIFAELQPGLTHGVIKIARWAEAEFVDALIRAVDQWPEPPEGKALWIGVSILEPKVAGKAEALPASVARFRVLPPLEPIPRQDAEDWTGQPVLRALYPDQRLREQLKEAINGEVFAGGIAELPMKTLAGRLYQLLLRYCA